MGVEDSYRLLHVDYKWGKGVITFKMFFTFTGKNHQAEHSY